MTAVEILFDYLRAIRDAKRYIATNRGEKLSADDIIALTDIARHLSRLEPDKADILAIEVEWSCNSEETLAKTKRKILSECGIFTELYLERQECFDKQCSYDSVLHLINCKAEGEFYFAKEAAEKEVVKWDKIFCKYNDITRLYNSMDCRPGQEEGDMAIIDRYREELYDMVGHPINLEKVNEEHDAAYKTLCQKKTERKEIADKTRNRFYELSEMTDSDVLFSLSSYAESLALAFSSEEDDDSARNTADMPTSAPVLSGIDQGADAPATKQKRGRGRPSKKERYAKAGITDLKSCFTNDEYYNWVVSEIEKEPANSIGGSVSCCIINCLFNSGYLKNEVKSKEDLANFMIDEFPIQYHISSGVSSYDYDIDAEKEQEWKQRLSKDNI